MQNSTPTAETGRGLTFGTHSRFSRLQRAWQHQFLSSSQLTAFLTLSLAVLPCHCNRTFPRSPAWTPLGDSEPAAWCRASSSKQDPFNPETSLSTEALPSPLVSQNLSSGTPILPHNGKPWLYSVTPSSGLLNLYYLVTYTLASSTVSRRDNLCPLCTMELVQGPWGNTVISDTGIFLITDDSPTWLTSINCPAKQKFDILVAQNLKDQTTL